ncbi:hypothetical protein AgCh_016487 [Apium graveolens]
MNFHGEHLWEVNSQGPTTLVMGSYTSKRRTRKSDQDESSEDEEYKEEKSVPTNLTEDDMFLIKDFIKTHSGEVATTTGNPLTRRIEKAKINRDLKVPSIEQFDGSIDSWSELKNKFKSRFSTNKKGRRMTASWVNIRQRSNESLREYLNRFRAETIQIPDLIENLAMTYLVAGADRNRHNFLLEEFFKKAPTTLQEGIDLFEHKLTLQEAVGSIQSSRSPRARTSRASDRSSQWEYRRVDRGRRGDTKPTQKSPTQTKRDEKTFSDLEGSRSSRMSQPKQRPWPPRPREERDFTKLSVHKPEILAIIKVSLGYRPPRPMNPNRPPSSRYCDYHEDTRHTTERCYQLKNLIEDKVQSGELAHFIAKEEPPHQPNYNEDKIIDHSADKAELEKEKEVKMEVVESTSRVCESKGKGLAAENADSLSQDDMEDIDEYLAFLSRRFSKLKFNKNFGAAKPNRNMVDKSKFKCFKCGLAGHFASECRKSDSGKKKFEPVDYKQKYFELLKQKEMAFITQENDWAADGLDEDEDVSYVNLALMAKSDETETSSSSNQIAKEELTESLKKEEILKKQLEREQEVIKAWKTSRDVHAQITKVQGIESFCDATWKMNKEKLEPNLVDGVLTDVDLTDDEDHPSDNKKGYASNDENPHPSAVSKRISKAKLVKLNEKYGSVSKNFVSGESSQVKKGKKANVGHMTVK